MTIFNKYNVMRWSNIQNLLSGVFELLWCKLSGWDGRGIFSSPILKQKQVTFNVKDVIQPAPLFSDSPIIAHVNKCDFAENTRILW